MKFLIGISIGLGMMIAGVSQGASVQVVCGDFQKGPAVKFVISPLEKTVKYTTFLEPV